ncbi:MULTISPECIES: sensor histidine kinase [Dyella]|uniref:sensor histidine kinase n=1 Tax=Dyella TaxID=231454 RepID=UPI0013F1746C|nr:MULTISPECIES: sensor histidine kinase [Dyella]
MKTPERKRIRPSIRRRLLAYLLAPLTVLLVIGVVIDHRSIVTPIHAAFDRSLVRTATAIAVQIRHEGNGNFSVPLPERPPPPLRAMPDERIFYRVTDTQGNTLAGTAGLPMAAPDEDDFSFRDVTYEGLPLRVVSYRLNVDGHPLVVTSGETTFRRERIVHQLDLSFGLNDFVQMLLVFVFALMGIAIATRPLYRLRDRIVARPARVLDPIDTDDVPNEVLPLVQSINTLLATVRDSALSQQHFLANAAHQLRTPLTGLKAQLEVMVRETSGTALQPRVEQLHSGIDRLAHTANQLLALARAEPSAHRSSRFHKVDLPRLIGEIINASLDRALSHHIDLGADCQPVQVQGLYWLLHEALNNLIDNAIRHTPAGGQITVSCGTVHGCPFLEVEDTGAGIAPAERDKVKERFYRGQNSSGDSCGLGLSIVDEAARAHGATFRILEGRMGKGTRMRIDFSHPAQPRPAGNSPGPG